MVDGTTFQDRARALPPCNGSLELSGVYEARSGDRERASAALPHVTRELTAQTYQISQLPLRASAWKVQETLVLQGPCKVSATGSVLR